MASVSQSKIYSKLVLLFYIQTLFSIKTADKRAEVFFLHRLTIPIETVSSDISKTSIRSALSCAMHCVAGEGSGVAFTYDSDQCACIHSLTNVVTGNTSSILYPEIFLSQKALMEVHCAKTPGYKLYITSSQEHLCLLFSEEYGDIYVFSDANSTCTSVDGGSLVVADTRSKVEFLAHFITRDTFIGLNDLETEDVFVWSDGRAMTETQRRDLFNPAEPNNWGGDGEHCGGLEPKHKLLDLPCNFHYPFVCQKPIF